MGIRRGFNQTGTVQLDGSGNGQVGMGPISAREIWYPKGVHVNVSTDINEAVCNIYVGDLPESRNFRDATASGSIGDSSDRVSNDVVRNPFKIWAVWTGGDPGSWATLNVTGEIEV